MLLRCKLAFHTRKMLLNIFELTLLYEIAAADMKEMLDAQKSYKLRMERFNDIRESAAKMTETGSRVV
jgi:hypothetical protein